MTHCRYVMSNQMRIPNIDTIKQTLIDTHKVGKSHGWITTWSDAERANNMYDIKYQRTVQTLECISARRQHWTKKINWLTNSIRIIIKKEIELTESTQSTTATQYNITWELKTCKKANKMSFPVNDGHVNWMNCSANSFGWLQFSLEMDLFGIHYCYKLS